MDGGNDILRPKNRTIEGMFASIEPYLVQGEFDEIHTYFSGILVNIIRDFKEE